MARTKTAFALPVLPVLALAGGCLDVSVFTHLGGVFASVMTSNLVFIAVAVIRVDGSLAVHAVAAVSGYVAGVAAGSALAPPSGAEDRLGTRPLSILLTVECALLAGVAAWWISLRAGPSGWQQTAVLVVAASAMGLQSAAAREMGNSQAGTTYLTGTLTGVVAALAARRRPDRQAVLCLGGLVAGAALAAVLLDTAPDVATLPPLVVVALVSALSWSRMDHHGGRFLRTGRGWGRGVG